MESIFKTSATFPLVTEKNINHSDAPSPKVCRHIHCTDDARLLARKRLPKIIFDYVDGAAGTENGNHLNQSVIEAIRLQPRVLVNVEERELGKNILGYDMGLPFGIAPMGMCNLTWPKADLMLADAAKYRNIPLCLSTASSTSMEDIYHRSEGMSWFQLYISQSVETSMQMTDRAEKAGYEVLILTVDVPQVARRIRDVKNGFEYPLKLDPGNLSILPRIQTGRSGHYSMAHRYSGILEHQKTRKAFPEKRDEVVQTGLS